MYDPSLYDYDRVHRSATASLRDGAYLYRLASPNYSDVEDILSGRGTLNSDRAGRFNFPHQRCTYCTDNILVAIAEALYHMHREMLERIYQQRGIDIISRALHTVKCLNIIQIKNIPDLVYLDSEEIGVKYGRHLIGSMAIFPDEIYEPFLSLADQLRREGKRGIISPSARHSKGVCIAFFEDETSRIIPNSLQRLVVELRLIPENMDMGTPPKDCFPYEDIIHPTMGYYSFVNIGELEYLQSKGIIFPDGLLAEGYIDFVRRSYRTNQYDTIPVLSVTESVSTPIF